MQKHLDGTVVVSATDLVGYLACDHLLTLELERIAGLRDKPCATTRSSSSSRSGATATSTTTSSGCAPRAGSIVEIPPELRSARTADELRAAAAATEAAMRDGADVVFQATFFDGRWRGHADFLVRADRPSTAGCLELRRRATRSSPATSRRAPWSRCASMPTCWRRSRRPARDADRGDRRRRRPRLPLRRLRRVPPAGEGALRGARVRGPRPRADLPRPGRPLSGVRLVADLHRATRGRRPPVARRGHDPDGDRAADG